MAKKLYFENVNSVDDFRTLLVNDDRNLMCISNPIYTEEEFNNYFESLCNITNSDKEKEFLKLMHHVDKKVNLEGQAQQNRMHKIPTILSCALLLDKYKEQFDKYNLDQKVLLAFYYNYNMHDDCNKMNEIFSKDVMDLITSLNKDFFLQYDYLFYYGYMIGDCSKIELIDYLKTCDIKEIMDWTVKMVTREFDNLGDKEHEGRRI